MAALLDLHPEAPTRCSPGVADVHGRARSDCTSRSLPLVSARPGPVVAELDRAVRRLEAYKLKVVAAADKAGTAKDAGFTGADAWLAKTTTCLARDAARQVALGGELDSARRHRRGSGRWAVSPEHAAVIVRATGELRRIGERRAAHRSESELVKKAARFSPDQLRRIARRAIEAVEPDQKIVDAHENELIRTEEQAAREKCSLDPARQRRRHHHRPLHHPRARGNHARQGHRRDDRASPDAPGSSRRPVRLAAPPRTRVRRAARAPTD